MKLPPPPPSSAADPAVDASIDQALRRADGLIAGAAGLALALDELGAVDLPPSLGPSLDQAQLRAVASLYLASELESAGVVAAAETLAGLGRSGGLQADLGAAAALLAQFWKARGDRPTAEERAGCFDRVFGSPAIGAPGFDDTMLQLCESLYRLDEGAVNPSYGGIAQQMRVRSAAVRLVERLTTASGGISVYLAQEVLQGLRESLAILGHPALRGAFGARDVWAVIAAVDRLAGRRRGDGRMLLRRGKAGMTVLAWLADAARHLEESSGVLVGLDHPVIAAATEWIEAALVIGESGAPPARRSIDAPAVDAAPPAGLPASPWAAIAA